MFCFNEVVQADVIQFIPNASDIDTEGIVINVELIIPKKIYHIISGTNFTGTLKEIVKNFQFVFCQFCFPTAATAVSLKSTGQRSGFISAPGRYSASASPALFI